MLRFAIRYRRKAKPLAIATRPQRLIGPWLLLLSPNVGRVIGAFVDVALGTHGQFTREMLCDVLNVDLKTGV